jgi:hypothetical protein
MAERGVHMMFPAPGITLAGRAIRGCSWLLVASTLMLLAISPELARDPASETGTPLEYQIKAAFLYNFTGFVEWPPEAALRPTRPLTIGILGKDPFGDSLDKAIKGKTSHGTSLVLKRYSRLEDLERCDLLFISRDMLPRLQTILKRIAGQHVLTVAEEHPRLEADVVITLLISQNKVRFEIDRDAAEAEQILISSKLLSLAQTVRQERKTPE